MHIKSSTNKFTIYRDSNANYEIIDKNFNNPIKLIKLNFDCDSHFTSHEFLYLTGLKENEIITNKELKNACFYLIQKNKFEQIDISVENLANGVNIHFHLKSFYTFAKLQFKGLLLGKDRYLQYYLLERGSKFDLEKHEQSISKMKEYLEKHGYFNAKIKTNLDYNENTKTVKISIKIIKGKLFKINNIIFKIENHNLNEKELYDLKKNISKFFINKFKKKYAYSWKFLKYNKSNLKKYLTKNNFFYQKIKIKKNIDFQESLVDLQIIISLKPQKFWNFHGNKYFSDKELRNFLLSDEEFLSDLPESILAEEICRLYKDKGFWDISIKAINKDNSYQFFISEGSRAIIEKIVIDSSDSINKKKISHKFFRPLLKLKCINDKVISESINNLINYYLSLGYWNVKVEKHLTKNDISGKYILTISIIQGERRYLKSVKIANLKELELDYDLGEFQNIKNPIPFNVNLLHKQSKYISNFFQKKGIQNFTIIPEFDQNKLETDLTWKVKINDTNLKIGKIIIQGNNKIPINNILQEINLPEGSIWKKNKIEDAFLNLNDFKIFDSVHLYPLNNVDFFNNKPMLLKLIVGDPFELRTRFGLQQVSRNLTLKGKFTYKVGCSFIYKNPLWIGDQLKLDADFSTVQKNFLMQYRIPWTFNKPFRTVIQLYGNTYFQPLYIGSNKNLYQIFDIGFIVNFAKKFEKINIILNCGIESIKIFGLSPSLALAIDFAPTLINKRVPYFCLEPNILIDKLNEKLNPTNGYLTLFALKTMISFSDIRNNFLKLLIEHSFFYPIFRQNIFAARLRFGYILSDKFSRLVPSERFYLGGPNSIRSYKPDFSPPFGFFVNEKGKKQHVPQGGSIMFNSNLEIRMPLFKGLSMVFFNDLGFLLKSQKSNINKILLALGFGFRYSTPIGPVRFDIGWRKKNHKEDLSYVWFLTLGQAF